MKMFLGLFFFLSASSFAANQDKAFFERLLAAYQEPASVSATLAEFKSRESVWLGECASKYDFSGVTYSRKEYYLPVLRHKTAPGEDLNVQFSAIDVGGNPYSGRLIETPADAIWYLRGEAGNRIGLAQENAAERALEADYYDDEVISLRKGKLGRDAVFLYTHTNKKGEIDQVCYFDEIVL